MKTYSVTNTELSAIGVLQGGHFITSLNGEDLRFNFISYKTNATRRRPSSVESRECVMNSSHTSVSRQQGWAAGVLHKKCGSNVIMTPSNGREQRLAKVTAIKRNTLVTMHHSQDNTTKFQLFQQFIDKSVVS